MNPYPRYRDSGVERLGEVPDHWQVMQLRRGARLAAGESPRYATDDGGIPVIGANGPIGWSTRASTAKGIAVGRVGTSGVLSARKLIQTAPGK